MNNDAWVQPFLTSLAATGIVSRACDAACVTRARVMARKTKDADFSAAFDDAMERAVDMVETEAWRRAIHGVSRPIIHKGMVVYETRRVAVLDPDTQEPTGEHRFELVLDAAGQPVPMTEVTYSDTVMLKILGAHRKAYSTERTELTGAGGGAVQMDASKAHQRLASIVASANARRLAEEQANEHGDIA